MKNREINDNAWKRIDADDTVRRGVLHNLLVRWRRMGYPAWLYFGAISGCAVVMIMPVVLLVTFADRLGVWWAILLALYTAILVSAYAFIVYPREMNRMRYILGDEAFFLVYPEEKKRELRRQERLRRRMARR